MRGKVTIQEIADFVGVSKFAVSRALAGKSGVSDKTRETILKAAGELGYFKNESNRSERIVMDRGEQIHNGNIVVLFPSMRYQNRESLYWGPVFDGISARLNERGLDILTLTEPSSDHVFSVLNPDAIDGIITVGNVSTSTLLDINRLGIPVVMVDHTDPAFRCNTVFADNLTNMRELLIKLISKGYKRFQFVGSITFTQSFTERWIAYRSILEQYDLPGEQIPELIGSETADIYAGIEKMKEDQLPEMFICVNDTTASFTIDGLKKRGIEVPNLCGVTGYDNTHPELPIYATVDVDKELLGRRAVDQMLWRIANPSSPVEKLLIAGVVQVRDENASALKDQKESM